MRPRTVKLIAAGSIAAVLTAVICSTAETNTPPKKNAADKIAELFGDPVLAKGTNVEVKRSELDSTLIGVKAENAARGAQQTPEQAANLEAQLLEQLIQIRLLLQKATEADRAKGALAVSNRYAALLKQAGSEEALSRQLKSVATTPEEFRAKVGDLATAQAVADRELNIMISDETAKKYYGEHPAEFERPETVRASHILLATFNPETRSSISDERKQAKRKIADDVMKRAKAGEDFTKLVQEFSEDPAAKENKGEYTFARGRMQMQAEFETAAFALQTNQISDVITTQFGYHIIKLHEKIPARKYAFDEVVDGRKVDDQIKDHLKRQELEKTLPAYITKLEAEAKVEILDERIKATRDRLAAARKDAAERAERMKQAEKKP